MSDCREVLKSKLKTLADSLQFCFNRDKQRLTEKLSEKDITDLEYQLWNYKEFVNTYAKN